MEMIIPLAAAWAIIAGAIVPFFTGFISKCSWADWVKALITILVSVVIGFATVAFSGDISFTAANVGIIIASTIGAAATVFWGVIKNVPKLKEWLYNNGIHDPKNSDPNQ